jgi:uncharacterized membrane protein (UPF0127 family)
MKKYLIAISVIIIAFLGIYYFTHPLSAKIKIRSAVFTVEVAATESQKELGLGGRASMPETRGMIFPYDHKEQFEFWMRGMLFPLDFVWIDGKTVVDVTENVPAPAGNERPIIVKPKFPADKVLEINAGLVQKYGIKVGDTVDFSDR